MRKFLRALHGAIQTRKYLPPSILAVATVLLYANSIGAPFHFDDFGSIVHNFYIHPPVNLWWLIDSHANRFILYFTLAANYWVHGAQVEGYHIVNIGIHALNAVLVFYLLKAFIRIEGFRTSFLEKYGSAIALAGALLFLSHPVQTNAVTYIIQRTAALAATFYLSAILFYISYRVTAKTRYIALTCVSIFLGMFTKENTFTIPFMLTLIEFLAFHRPQDAAHTKKRVGLFYTYLFLPIIPLVNLYRGGDMKASTAMSRLDYFFTQQHVILDYIRLLFYPFGQVFDYGDGYPMSHSFFENGTYLGFGLIALILAIGVSQIKRNKWIALGILWFFLALSVEASLLSIKDVYFEHRMYLPLLGFVIFWVGALSALVRWRQARRGMLIYLIFSAMLFGLYCGGTLQRNWIFKDAVRLWSDVTQKAPANDRAHRILGAEYFARYRKGSGGAAQQDLQRARLYYEKAIETSLGFEAPQYETLVQIYYLQKDYVHCIELSNRLIHLYQTNRRVLTNKEYIPHYYIGLSYKDLGKREEAIISLKKASLAYNVNQGMIEDALKDLN